MCAFAWVGGRGQKDARASGPAHTGSKHTARCFRLAMAVPHRARKVTQAKRRLKLVVLVTRSPPTAPREKQHATTPAFRITAPPARECEACTCEDHAGSEPADRKSWLGAAGPAQEGSARTGSHSTETRAGASFSRGAEAMGLSDPPPRRSRPPALAVSANRQTKGWTRVCWEE